MFPQIVVDAYRQLLRRGRIGHGNDKVSSGWAQAPGYIVARDEKASGVDGGDATAGAWQVRELGLNRPPAADASIAGDKLWLLAPGWWLIWGSAPAYRVNGHQTRIYNTSDSVVEFEGSSEFSVSGGGYSVSRSHFCGIVAPTLPDRKYEVQHRVTTTYAGQGFGVATAFGPTVYTILHALMLVHA